MDEAGKVLRTVLNALPDPATLFDGDTGAPVYRNLAARALAGELRTLLDRDALEAGGKGRGRRRRVLELVDAAGRTRSFESLACPIGALPAGPRLTLHFAREITARRRLEPPEQQGERLRIIGAMTAGLAHEIRTPLTSISNGARALKGMLPDLAGDARVVIDIIAKEAARAARLLGDVLTLARPRMPRVSREDLCRLVADAVAVARGSRPRAEAVVVDVAAEADRVEAVVDRDQIMQVLLNIIVNALDASLSNESTREPRVTVRLAPPVEVGAFCRVTVVDSGPGVAPEDRPRLFEPFFSRKQGGTGLGLTITRQIVEMHGGRLEIEEAPGGGATFVLSLPAAGVASMALQPTRLRGMSRASG